jgi:hypothetical protein
VTWLVIPPGLTDQVKVGVLGSSGKKLLENQRLQNWMKDLSHQNNRLITNKRKSEEMSIEFSPLKKRKLHKVGNHQTFDTVRISNLDDQKSGRLKGGFMDISISQQFYTTNLIANVGPKWKKEAGNDKVDCTVTHSWDDRFYCVERKGQKRHSIFKQPYFAIVIADQHHPAMLPAVDGYIWQL